MSYSYTAQQAFRRFRGGYLQGLMILIMICVLCVPVTLADDDDDDEWLRLHEEVQAGRIKPLGEILAQLSRDWVGDVIDVDIDDEDGMTLYEIELLGPEGQVVEFEVDARTGEILEMEGRDIDGMRRP